MTTTGKVNKPTVCIASENNIKIMTGEDLIDWVYKCIDLLSPKFKEQLGVSVMPQLII